MLKTLRRSLRDQIANLGVAEPAYRVYQSISISNPIVIYRNSRYLKSHEVDNIPLPPPALMFLVAGSPDISWFLKSGAATAASIRQSLISVGVRIEDLGSILDFGCGAARVMRHWRSLAGPRIFGTDYNPALIEWCRASIPFANFSVNGIAPPLAFGDAGFDLICAVSVFTHLTEQLQQLWMKELFRILHPGGYLLMTTHGKHFVDRLDSIERSVFDSGKVVVKNNTDAPGSNTCAAYHPYEYVRDILAPDCTIAGFQAEGTGGATGQDLYLLRRP